MKMHPLLEEKNYLACDVEVAALNALQDYMENNVTVYQNIFPAKRQQKRVGFWCLEKKL
jgi:hypothetical protein